jgi:hypothetical protein
MKIPINENFYVISIYRQSVNKNLIGFDGSAMGPPEEWDEFVSNKKGHGEYVGNWKSFAVNGYGYSICFMNNDGEIFHQWDLFLAGGAHLHYLKRTAARGVVGDPIDWACNILSDLESFRKQFKFLNDQPHFWPNKNGNDPKLRMYKTLDIDGLTLEDLQPLKKYIEGIDRKIKKDLKPNPHNKKIED